MGAPHCWRVRLAPTACGSDTGMAGAPALGPAPPASRPAHPARALLCFVLLARGGLYSGDSLRTKRGEECFGVFAHLRWE